MYYKNILLKEHFSLISKKQDKLLNKEKKKNKH